MDTENELLNKNTDCSICNFSGEDDVNVIGNNTVNVYPQTYRRMKRDFNAIFEPSISNFLDDSFF